MILRHRSQLATLIPPQGIAIELGVAAGDFSVELLASNRHFATLYSVDRWSDHHNEDEYLQARRALHPFQERSVIIRDTFEAVVKDFPDEFFDLIYVDGYAHTGQENGKTLEDWWPKLKRGGVFSGHDYHLRWPETMRVVDEFVRKHSLRLNLTGESDEGTYPSWWTVK